MAEELYKPQLTDESSGMREGSAVTAQGIPVETPDLSTALEGLGKAISSLVDRYQPVQPIEEQINNFNSSISSSLPNVENVVDYGVPVSSVTSPVGDWVTPEIAAFLNTISEAEGTASSKGYNMIVGLGKAGAPAYFSDFSKHPNIIGLRTSKGPSTAAGRYQIVNRTWRGLVAKYPELKDFSPDSQDKAAWILAQEDYRKKWGRDLASDLKNNVTEYLPSLKTTWEGFYYKNPISLFQKYMRGSNAANSKG